MGFNFITSNNFKYILEKLAENSDKFENIYGVSSRLHNFLNSNTVTNIFIHKSLKDLSKDKLVLLIEKVKKENLKIKDLFPDTLLKPNNWPKELSDVSSTRSYLSEYPRYFRELKVTALSSNSIMFYKEAIKTLEFLVGKFNNDISFSLPSYLAFEKKLIAATISNEIIKLKNLTDISAQTCAHMFRHRYITNFFVKLIKQYDLENQDDFRNALLDINSLKVHIQQVTGHKDLRSLDSYIDLAKAELTNLDNVLDKVNENQNFEAIEREKKRLLQELKVGNISTEEYVIKVERLN